MIEGFAMGLGILVAVEIGGAALTVANRGITIIVNTLMEGCR